MRRTGMAGLVGLAVWVVSCTGPAVGPGGPGEAVAPVAEIARLDWPMWRGDARRSAATEQVLPRALHLQWVRRYPPLEPAWPDEPRMRFDAAYAPVVMGGTMFVGSSRTDSVTALDTETGAETWRFLADGPVRFAPVAWNGKVYFACDDGCLYCLDAATGTLVWRFRGGPSDRRVVGNKRLISTWPARGGPVIADGTVYFTAGIWPFMGIFVHALDAETGTLVWTNDTTGAVWMKQPHSAPSFAGLAPQGYLVAVGDKLLVPNGRAVPACLDRATGRLLYFRLWEGFNYKRGNAHVAATSQYFTNDGRLFDLATGHRLAEFADRPVLTDRVIYGPRHAQDTTAPQIVEVPHWSGEIEELHMPPLWDVPDTVDRVWIKAGKRLYASRGSSLLAIDVPDAGREPAISWSTDVGDTPAGVLAAAGRLFVVTPDGRIACFGGEQVEPTQHPLKTRAAALPADEWTATADAILKTAGVTAGYALVLGLDTGRLVEELARRSDLHVIAVDPDARKVAAIRRRLDAAGLYGSRAAVHVGDPATFAFPPYLASLIVSEDGKGVRYLLPERPEGCFAQKVPDTFSAGKRFVERLFHALRPYGGVALLPIPKDEHVAFATSVADANLANAEVKRVGRFTALRRAGALPGSADWTHQYADVANTVVSKDRLVKAPLGLLWFGGSSNRTILPRHGHGPTPQVVAGRLIVEGPESLRAMDVYTGRVLWERDLPGLGTFYDNTSHQPGANAVGSNYVSLADAIYVAYGPVTLRLDPATGRTVKTFTPPAEPDGTKPAVGFIGVWDDVLLTGVSPQTFWDPDFEPDEFRTRRFETSHIRSLAAWVRSFKAFKVRAMRPGDGLIDFVTRNLNALIRERSLFAKLPGTPRADLAAIQQRTDAYVTSRLRLDEHDLRLRELNRQLLEYANWMLPRERRPDEGGWTWTATASKRLVAVNRHTGDVLWTRGATLGFRHNAIAAGAGTVFCIDRHPGPVTGFRRWKGEPDVGQPVLLALNARTGEVAWQTQANVFGTWLGYSEERDILLQARRPSRDMLDEKGRRLTTYRGATGEVLWSRSIRYRGPCLLHGDTIITQESAFSLLTGRRKTREHPVTRAEVPWTIRRQYGCNTVIASTHLLTFRSGAAGFMDLTTDGGTGNLGGFKSGCTSNLICANGVLAAPDYTRTCICSYQNQTSLGLVHDPDADAWTFNLLEAGAGPVHRVGINFGAPGDRRAPNGTLWLDSPSVGGPSPDLPIQTTPEHPDYFRRHPSVITGSGARWIAASGVKGLKSVVITMVLPPTEEEREGRAVAGRRPPKPKTYTVRLHFAEPDGLKPGARVFDVAVQGRVACKALDIVKEAGGPNRPLVREVTGVAIDEDLVITFTPADAAGTSVPVLCGIEVVAEE